MAAYKMDRPMKRRRRSTPIAAEVLESRVLLSAGSVAQVGGTVLVEGTNRADVIDLAEDGSQLLVTLNGRQTAFPQASVNQVLVFAGNGHDRLTSQISATINVDGGNGDDALLIVSSPANNVMLGGNGRDLVSSTGAGSDHLSGGNGADTIYAIVGAPNTALGGNGADRLIVRDGVETTDVERRDTLVAFRFDRPLVEIRRGVLYLMGTGGNDTYFVTQTRRDLIVHSGTETFTFARRDVDQIAGLLGAGDDVLVNQTSVGAVFYGTGGNDVLISGSADDVLKGGSGDDVILGGSGRNFLTGDAGRDLVLGDGVVLSDVDDVFANFSFVT